MTPLRYDRERVAQAKDLRRRWYDGEPVERVPFVYSVTPDKPYIWQTGSPYTFKEAALDSAKAVEGTLSAIQHQFDTFPDCDYLPSMGLSYFGEGILAALYGAEQYLVDNNPPYTKGRVYADIYETRRMSNDFEIEDTEWGRRLREHVTRFVDATRGEIPVEVADYQSPYGTATKLMPNEELMMAMYDEPELVHDFLARVTDGIIKLVRAMERWVGPENLALNRKNPIPGEKGLILWDDYISVLTPALHIEFCAPYNRRLFEEFGQGHLHTCGPYFPSYLDACLACNPKSLDVSIMRGMGKTREDMLAFLEITRARGLKLFGNMLINGVSVFETGTTYADDALLEQFIRGGYFPVKGGSYEEGLRFKALIESIGNSIYNKG